MGRAATLARLCFVAAMCLRLTSLVRLMRPGCGLIPSGRFSPGLACLLRPLRVLGWRSLDPPSVARAWLRRGQAVACLWFHLVVVGVLFTDSGVLPGALPGAFQV